VGFGGAGAGAEGGGGGGGREGEGGREGGRDFEEEPFLGLLDGRAALGETPFPVAAVAPPSCWSIGDAAWDSFSVESDLCKGEGDFLPRGDFPFLPLRPLPCDVLTSSFSASSSPSTSTPLSTYELSGDDLLFLLGRLSSPPCSSTSIAASTSAAAAATAPFFESLLINSAGDPSCGKGALWCDGRGDECVRSDA